jgi:hypothetical protein
MQEEPAEQPPWTIDTEIDSSLPQKKKREVKRMSDGDTSKLDPSSPKDRGGERERERGFREFWSFWIQTIVAMCGGESQCSLALVTSSKQNAHKALGSET